MIYWFTGQPSSGKTTLAKMLINKLDKKVFHIDGDKIREIISNKDYTIKGRVYNVDIVQKITRYLYNEDYDVVVSLVSPYLDQREEFKKLFGDDLKEIYVHTTEDRGREGFFVKGYQPPTNNFIDIDTTIDDENESLEKIIKLI